MTLPPDDQATQAGPPTAPPPAPLRPTGAPRGGKAPRLTAAGMVGVALIAGSLFAIVLAIATLGDRNDQRPTPVAVVPTATAMATDPARSGDPAASPDPSVSPTPTDGTGPEPGGTASPAPSNKPLIPLPRLVATIAGATGIRYYSIKGDRPIELIRQMERKGPTRCEDEALACVRLRVEPNVSYQVNASNGSCTITGASPTLSAVVQLPRWAKPARVKRVVLAWWREVFDHIAWHEGRHIQIERTWMRKLGGMLEGKPCASAGRVIGRWARKLAAAQAAFDAKDAATWTYPPFPGLR
jgi:predicted secreted Zn-dependent protease